MVGQKYIKPIWNIKKIARLNVLFKANFNKRINIFIIYG